MRSRQIVYKVFIIYNLCSKFDFEHSRHATFEDHGYYLGLFLLFDVHMI